MSRDDAKVYVPAAVRKSSIARLQEVADLYPAFGSACVFTVALLGVGAHICFIIYKANCDYLGSQTLAAALFRSLHLRFPYIIGSGVF